MYNYNDKVVVVTGATGSIGSRLALEFAKEGAIIVCCYKSNDKKALQMSKRIENYTSNYIFKKVDVSKKKDVIGLYKLLRSKYKRLDLLINNAGVCCDNLMSLMTYDSWTNIININLTGTFLVSKYLSRLMIFTKTGKIINIASLKGQKGSYGQANYSASKSGIIGLTKTLAMELGKFNISVNAVCPGYILTGLNKDNPEKEERAKKSSVMSVDSCFDDLVNFILFMGSEQINSVSGQIFNIDSRII